MTTSTATQEETLRCPTCGALQAWSDECRRCKCDLLLVRMVNQSARDARWLCLADLSAGRFARALDHCRRYAAILPGPDATRLMAVCYLLAEDWPSAYGASR